MIQVRFLLQFFSGLLLVAFELIGHEVVEPTGVFLSTDGFLMVQAKGHQQGRGASGRCDLLGGLAEFPSTELLQGTASSP